MSPLLQQVLTEIDRLSPTEQIEVLSHTIDRVKQHQPLESTKSTPTWSDMTGIATFPLMGEDAQSWVSRTRQEGDEHRSQILRGDK